MIEFNYNDGGRLNASYVECRDCTVRGFSIVSGKGYKITHKVLADYGRENRRGFSITKPIHNIARDLGIKLKLVKRSGSLGKLVRMYPKGVLLVRVKSHIIAIIDGVANDTFRPSEYKHVIYAWLVTLDNDQPIGHTMSRRQTP